VPWVLRTAGWRSWPGRGGGRRFHPGRSGVPKFGIALYGKLPDGSRVATAVKKSPRPRVRTARLEARVSRDFKDTLERAAAVTGHATLKSFLVFALQSCASKAIEDHRLARLSEDESQGFVRTLLAPPAPNAELRAAFGRYRTATGQV
jgi:uncharacterized protein (DUF1778 family)